jgi:ATP-binding cassette subfamily B protein
VTDEQIVAAARLAGAHDFVLALPEGYDTVVGERGATLSGGQRQRIAIARAAIRNAPIIILDEALTGLDRDTESEVSAALDRLTARRTTFVITHDLAAAEGCDVVVWVERGQVLAKGRPEEVLPGAPQDLLPQDLLPQDPPPQDRTPQDPVSQDPTPQTSTAPEHPMEAIR